MGNNDLWSSRLSYELEYIIYMQSIFIIGEQRSGSNLLRLMLDKSARIAAPHPPHILQRMMQLIPSYGSLEDEAIFTTLVQDVCLLVESNPVKWNMPVLNRSNVKTRCKENSLVAVFGAVMDIYAESNNAGTWVCKSMQNVKWLEDLEDYFDQPQYIYLHRDPRDVTLSFSKAVVGHKHPYFIANQWNQLQSLCLNAQKYIEKSRFFSLKYEELIKNPVTELSRLCDFIGIKYSDDMLAYYDSKEAQNTAKVSSLWKNVKNRLMIDNVYKYKSKMSLEDQLIVESVTSKTIDELKYQREFESDQLLNFNEEQIASFKKINNQLKSESEGIMDPEDKKRRSEHLNIIKNIINRS